MTDPQDSWNGLAQRGWTCRANFLPSAACTDLSLEIEGQHRSGLLHAAGVGRGKDFAFQPEIRTDQHRWLDAEQLSSFQAVAWNALQVLRQELNRELYLGLRWLEVQATIYPPGAFYRKHLDTFRGQATDQPLRTVSGILYLNLHWEGGQGGELRMFNRENPDVVEVEILPEMGTLALFLSREIYHEVLPTLRNRYSLAFWFGEDPTESAR